MTHVDVRIENGAWTDLLPDVTEICRQMVEAALAAAAPRTGPYETSIVLTDDAAITRLNHEFRGKDGPTNVLSFPTESTPPEAWGAVPPGVSRLIGDVVVAHETSAAEAVAVDRPFADHFRHLLIHGVLHLLGHDHANDVDAARMETLEATILADFGVSDPYADHVEENHIVA